MNVTAPASLDDQITAHNTPIGTVVLSDIYLLLCFLYVGFAGFTAFLIQIISFHCSQRKTVRMMRA